MVAQPVALAGYFNHDVWCALGGEEDVGCFDDALQAATPEGCCGLTQISSVVME